MKKVSKSRIVATYASSLYQAAEETKQLKKVSADVDALRAVFAADPQIVNNLSNQIWNVESKRQTVKEIAQKLKLGKEMSACLDILTQNGRMADVLDILDEFKHIYYKQHNIEEVEVSTVTPLSAAQDKKLKTLLEAKLGKEVLINYAIKPDLLGGLVIKYGSSMIDDSIQGKLTRLEIIMKGGQ